MRMKRWKKITAGALSICMMTTCAPSLTELGGILQSPVTVHAETGDVIVTGNCGKETKWDYNKTTKVMTITGTGTVELGKLSYARRINPYKTEVKKLVFSDEVTDIALFSFVDFTALEDIQFGGVKKIGDYSFKGCTSLKTLNLGENLEEIEEGAFSDCKNLTTVTVGSKLKTVYSDIFKGCDNLTSITVSKDNTYLYAEGKELYNYKISGTCGKSVKFSYNRKTKTLTLSGSGAMENGNYYAEEEQEFFPEAWESYRNFLTDSPYRDIIKQEVETVVIGDKITHIGAYAFADCKSLKQVKLGKKVTSIGNCAFSQCSKLNKISSLTNLKTIGNYAFYACKNLKSFSIGKSVKKIGTGVFCNCTNLKSLSIHKNNPYFSKRGNMLLDKKQSTLVSACFGSNKTCTIYGSVKSVDETILKDTSIKNFSVSKKNTKYSSKNGLLYSKNGKILKKCPAKMSGTVNTGNTATKIETDAFKNCNSITQINIGKNVSSINYAFCHISLKKLDKVQISNKNSYYYETDGSIVSKKDEKLVACYKIDGDTYTFPDSVQSVGCHVFCDQENLKKVIIPKNIDLNYCFDITETIHLNIESIHLGAEYNNPEKNFDAFWGLTTLKEITVSSENPYYTSVDGVLYNKEMNELVFLPDMIDTYSVPEGVTSIGYEFALCKLKNLTLSNTITDATNWLASNSLETLHLGKSVNNLGLPYYFFNLKSISVDEENNTFKAVNNLLYTKDGSQLLLCPAQTEGKVVLEPGVTTITGGAFSYCETITDIVIPDTLSEVKNRAFDNLDTLDNIVIWVPKGKKDFYAALFTEKTGFTSNMLIMELEN